MKKSVIFVVAILICVGISTRFIFMVDGQSWLPNFTAIGAIALFGANYLRGSWRIAMPFIALWVSDLILNNVFYSAYYDSFQVIGSLFVYGAFFVTILLGIAIMRRPSWTRLVVAALGSGVAFYLITNFAVWLNPVSPYMKNFAGLIECYAAAIPFFRNTLLGNLFYSGLLFGIYEYSAKYFGALQTNRQLTLV